jgi:hypothetical protein
VEATNSSATSQALKNRVEAIYGAQKKLDKKSVDAEAGLERWLDVPRVNVSYRAKLPFYMRFEVRMSLFKAGCSLIFAIRSSFDRVVRNLPANRPSALPILGILWI